MTTERTPHPIEASPVFGWPYTALPGWGENPPDPAWDKYQDEYMDSNLPWANPLFRIHFIDFLRAEGREGEIPSVYLPCRNPQCEMDVDAAYCGVCDMRILNGENL